jgi:PAS domain S-box-containing protein/putative nucleotidyltransferase with HDIG domain
VLVVEPNTGCDYILHQAIDKGIFMKTDLIGTKEVEEEIPDQNQYILDSNTNEEVRFKTLFENAQVGIYRSTPEGKVLAANPKFLQIVGFDSIEELSYRNLEKEGFSPETPRQVFKDRIEKEGEIHNLEGVWVRKDGSLVYVSENARAIRGKDGTIKFYEGTVVDIMERKQAEKLQVAMYAISQAAILSSNLNDLYKAIHLTLGELMPVENFFIALYDPEDEMVTYPYFQDQQDEIPGPNKAGRGLTGYVLRTGKTLFASPEVFQDLLQKGEVELVGTNSVDWLGVPLISKEKTIGAMVTQTYTEGVRFTQAHADLLTFVSTQVAMAIESKRAQEKIRQQAERLTLLNTISNALSSTLNLDNLLEIIFNEIMKAIKLDAFFIALYDPSNNELEFKINLDKGLREAPYKQNLGNGLTANVILNKKPLLIRDLVKEKDLFPATEMWGTMDLPASWLGVPILFGGDVMGAISVQMYSPNAYSIVEQNLLSTIADEVAISIINSRLYAAEKKRAGRLTEITRLGIELTAIRNEKSMLKTLVDATARIMECSNCSVILLNTLMDKASLVASNGISEGLPVDVSNILASPAIQQSIATGDPVIISDINRDAPKLRNLINNKKLKAFYAYPMVIEGKITGLLTLGLDKTYHPNMEEISSSQLLAERAATAIENTRLFEETNHNLNQVQALHLIDQAINSSVDINFVLNILLEKTRSQLGVDASAVLIFDANTQILNYAAGIGFRTSALQGTHLMLGQSYAGMAGLNKQIVHVDHMKTTKSDFLRSPHFKSEEFEEYYGIPLVAKDQLKGVLEIFHRSVLNVNGGWMSFLNAFAGQAAIAIDNAQLVTDLKSSNTELMLAYDTTIMGWSSALDLRDRETEGHTQRVTKATLRLAQAMGLPEADMVHIRRGALLHDIGKMPIPDSILLKPDSLNEEEWEIMRQHPANARKLLSSIAYLKPAMNIPYYHHENWDGTGYPEGISGENIPLEARIFAVVDVWDALRSKRRYRDAWNLEKVREYIRSQSGLRFDPRVVEVFEELINTEPLLNNYSL